MTGDGEHESAICPGCGLKNVTVLTAPKKPPKMSCTDCQWDSLDGAGIERYRFECQAPLCGQSDVFESLAGACEYADQHEDHRGHRDFEVYREVVVAGEAGAPVIKEQERVLP